MYLCFASVDKNGREICSFIELFKMLLYEKLRQHFA